jgi:hypothetical protein
LCFVAEAENDEGGILEMRVSGREKVLDDDARACGLLSGFNGAESGIWERSVLELDRERGRRVKLDEDSDCDVVDAVDFTGEEGIDLLVDTAAGLLSAEAGNGGDGDGEELLLRAGRVFVKIASELDLGRPTI